MDEVKVKAPTRISLFGGGTDIEPFASLYGGEVISLAINLYTEIGVYSSLGNSESWFDGITRSGIGSSGSYFASFIAAHAVANDISLTKREIAEAAWELENNLLRKITGKQDHYAAVYGGFNHIEFTKDSVTVTPLPNGNRVADHLVLFHTGKSRENTHIQKIMSNLSPQRVDYLKQMKENVAMALSLIRGNNLVPLGSLLHNQWELKIKANPSVVTREINMLYDVAQRNGAEGGKILGAGGGGYIVFFVPLAKRLGLIEAVTRFDSDIQYVPFKIDSTGLAVKGHEE